MRASVLDDQLVISIGIGTLAWAAKTRNGGPVPQNVAVADHEEFARDVARSLCREDEVGNTLLTRLLDDAMTDAMNGGSIGLRYPPLKRKKLH